MLALAESIAREAGELLVGHFAGARLEISSKTSPTDLVSEADLAAEKLIRARIESARPDDAILGEEGEDREGSSGLRWVVDPLDGTINYLYGIPQWCVSIAVEDAAGTLAAVIYDAMRDECWTAEREGEAALNGRPIASSRCEDLSQALVGTGFGYDAAVRERQAAVIARVLPRVRDIRRAGSAALELAWAAGGRLDCFFERGVQPWDVAAGLLICERAGLAFRPLDPDPPAAAGVLVAPAALADDLLSLVA